MERQVHKKSIWASLTGMLTLLLGMASFSLFAQLTETFDNTSLPPGWTNTSSTGSTSTNALWKFSGNPGYAMSGTQDHTGNGGSFAWVDGSTPSNLTSTLESPNVNMTGTINPELRFWLKSDYTGYNTTPNTFTVDVYDGTTWNTGAFTFSGNTANLDWEQFSVPLGGFTFTGNAKFRFNVGQFGSTAFYNDIALDDIEIVSILDNDAGLTAVLNPSLPGCTVDSVVTVELKNFGALNLTSAQVNWSINGNLQTPASWTGNLVQYDMDTVTVGTNSSIAFGDTITVWTSNPNGVTDSASVNDTTQLIYIAGYSGVKTIDPSGNGDFISFTDAVNKLNLYGTCGNLIVEVVSGTYVEQFALEQFTGMDANNRVTFRSQAMNPDSVIVTYSSTGSLDNYVIQMHNAPYFTLEGITFYNQGSTYAYALNMWGSDDVTIDNCIFKVDPATSSLRRPMYVYSYQNSTYAATSNFTMTNSKTIGGYYGIYFYNYTNTGSYGNNIVLDNNEFLDAYYYGAYVYYNDNLQFTNNHIMSNLPSASSFGYGALIGITTNGEISGNYIEGSANWPRYGLYTTSCSGDLTTFMPVTNNRVYLPGSNAYYGIYASNSLFVDYSLNSVYINGNGTSTRGIYAANGSYNKFKNNNIQVTSTGAHAMYVNGNAVYQSDYNNLSAPNGHVGYSGGSQTTLVDWQNATGFDANSVVVNDVYSDTTILKVCTDSLYGMGEANPLYTMDYQGDVRQTPPCIGADEFLPISQFGFNTNPVLCTGDTLVLEQYYYDTVVWNGIDTANTLVVTAPGSQSVSVYDACGTGTSNFVVVPQENADVADTNLCEGTTAVLETGISGGTYMWSTGSTDSTITVSSAQTVYVTVVDAAGCTSTDTAVVTQSTDVVLNDTSFCEGESVALNTNMTGTYAWSDGSTNQILNVTASGTYSVTVTDQNCISSASATVTEILNVVPSFTDSSDHFTVVFTNTTQNATSYLWDFGDGTTSTDVNPIHVYPWTPADVVEYTVTLTAYNSCGDDEAVNDGVRAGQLVSVSEVGIESMINVYPNPNNGLFTIAVTTTEASEMSVQVVDTKGSLVYNQSYGVVNGEVNRQVQLENAAQGIYFVKVTLNGETAVYRLAVE